MKKTFTLILFFAFATLLTVSCKKDDTLRYGNVTMGNLVDGKFISDQGNTFNMVEMNTSVDLKKFRRGIMRCDVLREAGEKEYDVRVTYMDTVLTKVPIPASIATEDEEKVVEDPIHIEQLWISGGYVNMYVIFEIQLNPKPEKSKHMVNFVLDDSVNEKGKYIFTLRHNSFGDTFKAEQEEEGDRPEVTPSAANPVTWGFAGSYVSFPISDLISDQSADVTIKWKSHVITDTAWSSEICDKAYSFTYSKDYFEHAPLNIRTRSAVRID